MNCLSNNEHIEIMKTMVSTTYGVPTDQVCAWDCLDRETQFQIAKHAGLTADFVTSFSWVAMPLEAHKKLYAAAKMLKSKGENRLKLITDFVEAF